MKNDRQQRLIAELKDELSKVKLENSELIDKCMEPDIELSELIETLKDINIKWQAALDAIEKTRYEYTKTLKELHEFRNNIIGSTRLQRRVTKFLTERKEYYVCN